jgi:hypothetical protein
MSPEEKRDHLRDLARKQRAALGIALQLLRRRGLEASEIYHYVDDADRLADLVERTAFTMFSERPSQGRDSE